MRGLNSLLVWLLLFTTVRLEDAVELVKLLLDTLVNSTLPLLLLALSGPKGFLQNMACALPCKRLTQLPRASLLLLPLLACRGMDALRIFSNMKLRFVDFNSGVELQTRGHLLEVRAPVFGLQPPEVTLVEARALDARRSSCGGVVVLLSFGGGGESSQLPVDGVSDRERLKFSEDVCVRNELSPTLLA